MSGVAIDYCGPNGLLFQVTTCFITSGSQGDGGVSLQETLSAKVARMASEIRSTADDEQAAVLHGDHPHKHETGAWCAVCQDTGLKCSFDETCLNSSVWLHNTGEEDEITSQAV